MQTNKERVFTVMVNGPANTKLIYQCAYFDHTKGQYVWLDKSNKIHRGDLPKANVKILTLDKGNPAEKLRILPNALPHEKTATDNIIEFWKNNPEVGKSTVNGLVDSYPSQNHKMSYADYYRSAPNEALPQDLQKLVYIDEIESAQEKSKILKLEREVLNIIETLSATPGLLNHYAYVLGINPEGYEQFEVETLVYDLIKNTNMHNDFVEMIGKEIHKDPVTVGCHIGITSGIITKNPGTGIYQFEGNLIGKTIEELSYHFKHKTNDWNVLLSRLGDKANHLPFESSKKEESKQVVVEETKKESKPKATKVKEEEPASALEAFVNDED